MSLAADPPGLGCTPLWPGLRSTATEIHCTHFCIIILPKLGYTGKWNYMYTQDLFKSWEHCQHGDDLWLMSYYKEINDLPYACFPFAVGCHLSCTVEVTYCVCDVMCVYVTSECAWYLCAWVASRFVYVSIVGGRSWLVLSGAVCCCCVPDWLLSGVVAVVVDDCAVLWMSVVSGCQSVCGRQRGVTSSEQEWHWVASSESWDWSERRNKRFDRNLWSFWSIV
jgi:hypothetical protein